MPTQSNYGFNSPVGDGLGFFGRLGNNARYGFDWMTGSRYATPRRNYNNWLGMNDAQRADRWSEFRTNYPNFGGEVTRAATPNPLYAGMSPEQVEAFELSRFTNQYGIDPAVGGYVPMGNTTPERSWKWLSTPEQTGVLETGAAIGKGIGEVWGAWNQMQQNDLMQDQFDYQRDMANRNLANQASLINQRLEDRYNARIGATGTGGAGYNYAKPKYVDGTPV